RRPRRPPLFPYTTLFRSRPARPADEVAAVVRGDGGVTALVLQGPEVRQPEGKRNRGDDRPGDKQRSDPDAASVRVAGALQLANQERKSTRLNSSHLVISY